MKITAAIIRIAQTIAQDRYYQDAMASKKGNSQGPALNSSSRLFPTAGGTGSSPGRWAGRPCCDRHRWKGTRKEAQAEAQRYGACCHPGGGGEKDSQEVSNHGSTGSCALGYGRSDQKEEEERERSRKEGAVSCRQSEVG
jgi:hypothetical protein